MVCLRLTNLLSTELAFSSSIALILDASAAGVAATASLWSFEGSSGGGVVSGTGVVLAAGAGAGAGAGAASSSA